MAYKTIQERREEIWQAVEHDMARDRRYSALINFLTVTGGNHNYFAGSGKREGLLEEYLEQGRCFVERYPLTL